MKVSSSVLREVRREVLRLEKANSLPALVFSRAGIRENMVKLGKLGRKFDCSFAMALKSFPDPEILRIAGSHLDGFEISNHTEWEQIRASSGKTKALWLNNPALDRHGMTGLSSFSRGGGELTVNCETLEQVRGVTQAIPRARVAFRLNSSDFLGSREEKNESNTSRFGIRLSEIHALESFIARRASALDFGGFTFHHGRRGNTAEIYLMLALRLRNWARRTGIPLPAVNFGGGLAHLGWEQLEKMLADLRKILPEGTRLWFEPGRLLTRGAGFAAGRIIDRRKKGEQPQVVTDLSLICHLQWSFPEDVSGRRLNASVVGPTCYEWDRIGKFHISKKQRTVLVGNVSGYSVGWNRAFNGIPVAKVVILK